MKMNNKYSKEQDFARPSKSLQIKQVFNHIKNAGRLNKIYRLAKVSRLEDQTSLYVVKNQKPSGKNKQKLRTAHKFLKYFCTETTDDFLYSYLERIQSVKVLVESPILEIACYIYAKIFNELEIDSSSGHDLNSLKLLTFGVSINIAQKYHFDRDIHPESIQKLLGVKKKQLYQREIFILTRVFGCCFSIDEKEFNRFNQQLYRQ